MPTNVSPATVEDDPLWYQNAVIYQTHVRAFCDSDGDGVGDFRGLTSKLDYLAELGITAIWILPFYPSPLRDDGYDTADYTDVHPAYGTIADLRRFIREAHKRGLRVITELVLNHTSDQHPWFQRARRAKPGTSQRDFYVWSESDEKYGDTRIIFKDFEASNWTWDPVAQAFYWHRFYSHQPDLNFDHPPVHKALLKVVDFWFNMGVDGLRLDAVPYLYEREGTTCENLPETHEFLKKLRRHVDRKFKDRMLLAEANQWPEDAIAYFGDGDECHMAFHFPLMPRLFMAARMEDRFPIIDILQQTPEIPGNCQWAVFLRNHDELTLEMVTDEERDYMYRVYAHDRQARINLGIRRRLAPLLSNDRRKIELMNGLLFSMPGTPVIYYGDEIGMGDNVFLGDRNGVRTPMQWTADRNAGFSRTNPQQLYMPVITDPEYNYETVNVEAQLNNPSSLLWWVRRLIALRQRYPVFGRGATEFLHPDNPKVLAFIRRSEEQQVLVVANLSRFVQSVELDLSEFRERVPVELFGFTQFPPIGDLPYFLTLGPHAFYWFELQDVHTDAAHDGERKLPTITLKGGLENLFTGNGRAALERALPKTLVERRWFGGKGQSIESCSLVDATPIAYGDGERAMLALFEVAYVDAEPETYQLPLTMVTGDWAEGMIHDVPHAVYARLKQKGGEDPAVLIDAAYVPEFCRAVYDAINSRRRFKGRHGEVRGRTTSAARRLRPKPDVSLEPSVSRAEQSNSSIVYGEQFIFKFFRRVGDGVNPDLEIGRFLTERQRFEYTAPVTGYMEYQAGRAEPRTLGMLVQFRINEGDAWRSTLSALSPFFERVQTDEELDGPPALEPALTLARSDEAAEPPEDVADLIGPYLQAAELLGRRTAQMHLALAADHDDPAFAPESFTMHQQRSMYQSMRNLTRQAIRMLRRRIRHLPESIADDARRAVDGESLLLERLRDIKSQPLGGRRIRTHGDYHLGQVLSTGRDFIIIDFEGEPARPMTERRMKRSPLRDVAGMLRSFDYAANTVFAEHVQRFGVTAPEVQQTLLAWAGYWRTWVEAVFLRGYLDEAGDAPILPRDVDTFDRMLHMFLLEKTVYELQYEINNRPQWVSIPLAGVLELIESEQEATS